MTSSNASFAAAFAPLLEVLQGGRPRPATAADVLEVLEPPRYVLKRERLYLGDDGRGWTPRQKEALFIDDHQSAEDAKEMGLREYGVRVRIVRVRRRGTLGIEGYRLRPDIEVSAGPDGKLDFLLSQPEAMQLLAALTGAAERSGTA